jgi:hypothetical protein
MKAYAQEIDVGPVKVDTGNDWMDFGFALVFVGIFLAVYVIFIRRR